MDELRKWENLLFTKVDKGGALVIKDVEDYVKEADRQLNENKFYKKLSSNPTKMYAEQINKSIDQESRIKNQESRIFFPSHITINIIEE